MLSGVARLACQVRRLDAVGSAESFQPRRTGQLGQRLLDLDRFIAASFHVEAVCGDDGCADRDAEELEQASARAEVLMHGEPPGVLLR